MSAGSGSFLRLLGVELRRLRHRRAVLLLLIGAVLAPVAIGIGVASDTRPSSDADRAQAERALQREIESGTAEEEAARCVARPVDFGLTDTPADEVEQTCRERTEPRLDWFLLFDRLDVREQQVDGSGVAVAVLTAMVMMLVGVTFVGHDWATGAVSNQLLFEPRRLRVLGTKALAVSALSAVVAVVVLVGYSLGLNLLAASRDADAVTTDVSTTAAAAARGVVTAVAGGLLGLTLTSVLRSTVGALGVVVAAFVGLLILPDAVGLDGGWNPVYTVDAMASGASEYRTDVRCPPGEPIELYECEDSTRIGFAQGLGSNAALLVLLGGAAAWSFRRRDVS